MKKSTLIWLIIASCLVIIGIIIFIAVMTAQHWDFVKLGTGNYETNVYEITNDFNNISIDTDTADITFALSNNEKCSVSCFEEAKTKHSVAVENDTLVITKTSQKKWYDYIEISFSTPKITVYLPKAQYNSLLIEESTGDVEIPNAFSFESVDISLSTGDIDIKNVSVSNLELFVSTGDIELENLNCENLTSSGSTGDIELEKVIAKQKIVISRSTGDIELKGCDAQSLDITTDTGEVTGYLLSEKIFKASSSTGRVSVPDTLSGGECKITTSTGDIKLRLAN